MFLDRSFKHSASLRCREFLSLLLFVPARMLLALFAALALLAFCIFREVHALLFANIDRPLFPRMFPEGLERRV